MAEILGVVASGITVVQVAAQLLDAVKKLRSFYRSMRDVPEYLQSTLNNIELVGLMIDQVRTFDDSALALQGSSMLQDSVLSCEAATSALQKLAAHNIQRLSKKGKFRTVYLKAVFPKEEMEELKTNLESTKRGLMDCYMLIMTQKIYHGQREQARLLEPLQRLLSTSQSAVSVDEGEFVSRKPKSKNSASINNPLRYQQELCSRNRCCCVCHDTLLLQGRAWSLKLPSAHSLWKPCNKKSCENSKNASLWIGLSQIGIPYAIRAGLSFMFNSQRSFITPSLDFQRVVRNTSPGFKLLWELETEQRGDWTRVRQDLMELFDSGQASPRDVDRDGRTWLEKILHEFWRGENWNRDRTGIQVSLVTMLVRLGTQVNTPRLLYQCASWRTEKSRLTLIEDLIRFGFDASEIDAPAFSLWPEPCRVGYNILNLEPDPFFVEWISKNLEVCPGFAGLNPLLEAILTESNEEVQRLIAKIPVDDQENLLGQSALHLAVSRPQHLEILLKSGADVDATDKYGITPLMYAGAIGSTEVAIRLLNAGANPYPNALRHRNFLQLAATRGYFTTVRDILTYIHSSPGPSKYASRDLLALGLVVLADISDDNWKRDAHLFQTLLEWGADPNVPYFDCHGRAWGTLLHKIRDTVVVKSTISHGFTQFNYLDSTGAHALMSSSAEPDPRLMELLLNGGSIVNHQNYKGHTTLHMVAQHLKNYIQGFGSNQHEDYDTRIHVLDCIKLLLERQADPCLGDKCRCACSRLGCTPSNLIIKEHIMSSSSRKDIWAMEFFALVEETRGIETAKQCLLDMLRLVKFEELELTHTCQQETFFVQSLDGGNVIDEEDVQEILDEEEEIIETLEQEMLDIERLAWDDLEQLLLRAVVLRKWDEGLELELQSRFIPQITGLTANLQFKVDYWRDEFVAERKKTSGHEGLSTEVDTVGVSAYAGWAEYEYSRRKRESRPDNGWHEKRIRWISTVMSMQDKAEMSSVEGDISDEVILSTKAVNE